MTTLEENIVTRAPKATMDTPIMLVLPVLAPKRTKTLLVDATFRKRALLATAKKATQVHS